MLTDKDIDKALGNTRTIVLLPISHPEGVPLVLRRNGSSFLRSTIVCGLKLNTDLSSIKILNLVFDKVQGKGYITFIGTNDTGGSTEYYMHIQEADILA